MTHVVQLALGACMSSLSAKGCSKCWEAHERDKQFGENEITDSGKSQWLRNEGNARNHKVSAMRPGWARIIGTVRISSHFEWPEPDPHIKQNVLITMAPGHRNEFIDCQKAKVWIPVLTIMDVKTFWNSTLELLERAYQIRRFTPLWLKNPTDSYYRPLITTQNNWTIIK